MAGSYLPTRDAALDDWILNFRTLIAANPSNYSLQASDATAITNSYTAWHAAYLAAINPTTRTRGTVATKDLQKAAVLGVVRGYAATIRANRAVSDELKIGLGLRVRDTRPSPVPPPSTKPVLAVTRMEQGVQELRATDEGSAGRRGKPANAAGMLLYRVISTTAVNDPAQSVFIMFASRTSVTSTFTPADSGKVVTYFARWTNGKGEVGPWSQALSASIAA